jgi:N-acetylmuramoyl-L-alanine amidase
MMLALLISLVPIIDRPIRFDDERKALTLAYRQAHSDPKATDITIVPQIVVIHHTAFATLEQSFQYFDRTRIEGSREELARAGDVNVSAHFLVDLDGKVYRLMPETWMARHCIGLNHVAIGIENVGGAPNVRLTEAQVDANAALIRDLKQRHDIVLVIGHHEYRKLEREPWFLERDASYRTTKVDPGPDFMRKVRARIKTPRVLTPPRPTSSKTGSGK